LAAPLLADKQPLILYCGGGISASVDALVLTILGRRDVSIYDGSLQEWSADPALPLELGPAAVARS
jgi:thiosulfate/3-mercaptopyruvate sulfurtransferase